MSYINFFTFTKEFLNVKNLTLSNPNKTQLEFKKKIKNLSHIPPTKIFIYHFIYLLYIEV